MFRTCRLHFLILLLSFFVSPQARGQSQTDEIDSLPIAFSPERLQSLEQISPIAVPATNQPRARRRLPRPMAQLTPEEIAYRDAVRQLGVDRHRYVHCDLPNGKVRTGVILQIRDEGFLLKDGIINAQWIRYTDLKGQPRQVPAIGTHIVHGLKWGGLVVGVVAVIPLIPLFAIGLHGDC